MITVTIVAAGSSSCGTSRVSWFGTKRDPGVEFGTIVNKPADIKFRMPHNVVELFTEKPEFGID